MMGRAGTRRIDMSWLQIRSFTLLTLLYLYAASADDPEPSEGKAECSECSIYILDLASFAATHDYPICDLNKVVVNPTTGVVYLRERDTGIQDKASHEFGTHSAPWYLKNVSPPRVIGYLHEMQHFRWTSCMLFKDVLPILYLAACPSLVSCLHILSV